MDALNLIEVNAPQLEGLDAPVVVLAATWGRGCKPELLRALEPFRRSSGYNGTLVAGLTAAEARDVLGELAPEERPGQMAVLSIAFGKTHLEWRERSQ